MNELAAARPFMQVVHVLRDDQDFPGPIALEASQRQMGCVRDDCRIVELRSTLIVEPLHQGRITRKCPRRCHLLDPVPFP